MERLIIEVDSAAKAAALQSILTDMEAVKSVIRVPDGAAVPQSPYKSEEEFLAEIERRTEELENGTVRGLSIEELEAGAQQRLRKRA
jgi:hypothetical protein